MKKLFIIYSSRLALSIVWPSFWCTHWKAKNYISLKLRFHNSRTWVLNVKSSYLATRWHGTQQPFLRGQAGQLRTVLQFLKQQSRPQLPWSQAAGTWCWSSQSGHKFPFLLLLCCNRFLRQPVLGLTTGPCLSLPSSTTHCLCRRLTTRSEPHDA